MREFTDNYKGPFALAAVWLYRVSENCTTSFFTDPTREELLNRSLKEASGPLGQELTGKIRFLVLYRAQKT